MSGSDQQFRAVRAQWYQDFTGEQLEANGSLAEQQRVFDAVARSWRAYSDGWAGGLSVLPTVGWPRDTGRKADEHVVIGVRCSV